MLVIWPFKCEACGKRKPKAIDISELQCDWECDCGSLNTHIISTVSTGHKLLYRSYFEIIKVGDYNLSIVFSAMAVDCELSHLFKKWEWVKRIKENRRSGIYEPPNDNEIECLLLKYRRIQHKFKNVFEMCYPDGIEHFLERNQELEESLKNIVTNFSPRSFYRDIDRELFWKRNKILHDGVTSYGKPEAMQCYAIADILLQILNNVDSIKRSKADLDN